MSADRVIHGISTEEASGSRTKATVSSEDEHFSMREEDSQ